MLHLRYAARLGGNDGIFDGHELYLGDNLADGGPHTVKVERKGKVVTVTLDPEIRNPIIREEKGMYANLDLDQYIFTGGSTGLSSLHGVDSNSNFMGCIMESKFSYKTPSGDTEEIDLLVQSKQVPANMPACPKNQEYQPVSFPGGGSRLTIDTGKDSKMIGSFKFRTYKSEGVLLKQKNFEISYRLKSVTLEVQSSPVTVSPSKLINQGNWFTVEFEVSAQSLKLTVDGQPSNLNGKPMDGNFFDSDTVFGTDFIGCMRDIVINSAKIDPKNAPTSDRPKVVDKCIIHDFCHPNPCQNDGTCKQDGVTFDCQCVPDSGYEGAICQLRKYTCQLFLIPMREIFFRVPWLPERGLGLSSKGTGASRTRLKISRWAAASHVSAVYPTENALFPVIHGKRRHLLIPHQLLPFQILQSLFDFDRKSAVLASCFSKSPECFSRREILPRSLKVLALMWETAPRNAGDLAGLRKYSTHSGVSSTQISA